MNKLLVFVFLMGGCLLGKVPKKGSPLKRQAPQEEPKEVSQVSPLNNAGALPEKPMVIIIPSYNNAMWYMKNLGSVFDQEYQNYRIIYIDDCSSDDTSLLVERMVLEKHQEGRCTLICNKERRGALANLYYAILQCEDDAIVVTLDGDDWFAHTKVLQKLNEVYLTQNVWLTHGTLRELRRGKEGWCIPIPKSIVAKNAFRSFRCPSHLRTFYAWLFKKIRFEDLQYEGDFFKMTWDQAIMFPMLEMAGERHAYIDEVVYIYNDVTPLNDNKVNPQLQRDLEAIIRGKPAYQRLPTGFPANTEKIMLERSVVETKGFFSRLKHYKPRWMR